MREKNSKLQLKKLIDRYNYVIVVLFCGTNLTPILNFYFYGKGEWKWLIITLVTSLLIGLLPMPVLTEYNSANRFLFTGI